MEPNEKPVDTQAIADAFAVSARSVINWAVNDGCPHLKAGGVYRFYLSEVMAWARARGAAPAPAVKAAV